MNVTIIGFGEAGPVIGEALLDAGMTVTAYDCLQDDTDHHLADRGLASHYSGVEINDFIAAIQT